jgi:hypothetical protein
MLSPYANPLDFFPQQMRILDGQTLSDNIAGVLETPNFREQSIAILHQLQLIEECDQLSHEDLAEALDDDFVDFASDITPSGYRPRLAVGETKVSCAKLWMVWELRNHLAESLLLGSLLPKLYREFLFGQADRTGAVVSTQIKFCLFLITICHREPYSAELVESGHYPEPLFNHPYVVSHELVPKLLEWEGEIGTIQETIAASGVFGSEWMMLKPGVAVGNPLDATLFHCIIDSNTSTFSPKVKQFLKESVTSLSVKLIKIHNTLMRDKDPELDPSGKFVPGRYAQFEIITRKCISRLQYISRSLVQDIVRFPKYMEGGFEWNDVHDEEESDSGEDSDEEGVDETEDNVEIETVEKEDNVEIEAVEKEEVDVKEVVGKKRRIRKRHGKDSQKKDIDESNIKEN